MRPPWSLLAFTVLLGPVTVAGAGNGSLEGVTLRDILTSLCRRVRWSRLRSTPRMQCTALRIILDNGRGATLGSSSLVIPS